jgi:hypothetical protein
MIKVCQIKITEQKDIFPYQRCKLNEEVNQANMEAEGDKDKVP